MNAQELTHTARTLVAADKGLLAMDESNSTCNKRFAKLGIPQTEAARRAWRELIVTTPGLGECISGLILYDETIRQRKKDGTPFLKVITDTGVIPGIKVDTGAKDMAGHPGEKITEGLDGLRDRLAEYFQMGARFAKWRAVIAVGGGGPRAGGTASSVSASQVQSGCAPWRIQCRDGEDMSLTLPMVYLVRHSETAWTLTGSCRVRYSARAALPSSRCRALLSRPTTI